MRPSRGGPRARGASRGGLRNADNSGDESSGRKDSRRVRFEEGNGTLSAAISNAIGSGATSQVTSRRTKAAPAASNQRNLSPKPRRGIPNQRVYNSALSQAARAPAALSRSFGAVSNPTATKPTVAVSGQQSYAQRYQNLKKTRERDRQEAIANGFLADPDKPRTLAEAITPVGTCPDMCAEFERLERVVQNDVWDPELKSDSPRDGQTSSKQQPDEARMVKKFRRAAAGIDEQLPSDLRPPHVLQKTCDYLFNDLIEQADSLASVHHFVWDRTRAIRNDFSIQQISKISELRIAIDCYERIARFHILSLHQLALPEKPYDKYDAQQEREQLDKTLLSLMQYYDDSRGRLQSPNEPEFRAYGIIFQIQDPIPDLEDRVQTWPAQIANDGRVHRALSLYAAACNVDDVQGPLKPLVSHPIAQGNWARFWKLVESKQTSYLMCCVAEIYFPLVRRIALNAIWTSFRAAKRNVEDWTLEELMPVLGFQDVSEVERFCESYGFTVRDRGDGMAHLDLESVSGRTLPSPAANSRMQARSDLVEHKRHHRLLSAIISGMTIRTAREADMIDERLDQDEVMDEGQSLFIQDDSDEDNRQKKPEQITNSDGLKQVETNASALNPFASQWSPATTTEKASASQPQGFNAATTSDSTSRSNGTKIEFGKSLFPNSGSLFQATGIGNAPPSQQHIGQPASSTAGPSLFSGGSGLFSSVGKQSEPASQGAPKSLMFPQSSNASSSGQQSLFKSVDSSASSISAGQASLFNPAPVQSTVPKPTNTDDRPFSFLGAKTDAANEASKPFAGSSFFAGLENTEPSSAVQTNLTADESSSTPQEPAPTKSLFDRISNDKNTTSPSPQTLTSQQSQISAETPPSTFKQPRPTADNFKFTSGSQNLHSSLTPFSNPPTASSSASTSFTSPSNAANGTSQSNPPAISGLVHPPAQGISSQAHNPLFSINPSRQGQPQAKSAQQIAREKAAEEAKRSAILDQLARSLVTDPSGFLEQYIEFTIGPMIKAARQQVMDERTRKQADEFRLASISRRYGMKWREVCWGRRVARQGTERRQRMAREKEARAKRSRESSISSVLDDFRKSTKFSKSGHSSPESPEPQQASSLDASTLQGQPRESNFVSNTTTEQRRFAKSTSDLSRSSHRRSGSAPNHLAILESPATSSRTARNHRPSSLRRSFLPDDLVASNPAQPASSIPRSDTTRSTYFRLKAMGIDPSGLTGSSERKRPRSSDSHLAAFASPGKRHLTAAEAASSSRQMPPPSLPSPTENQNKATLDEDEELFAAVREARQAMSDSVSFFRDEIAKEEEFRKSWGSEGSPPGVSPPNIISSHASTYSSNHDARGSSVDSRRKEPPPAYRNRISKFLPRERYADMRMDQKQQQQQRQRNSTAHDPGVASEATKDSETSRSDAADVPSALASTMNGQPHHQSEINSHSTNHLEAQRPNTRDSMFTPDVSFGSFANPISSFASPQAKQSGNPRTAFESSPNTQNPVFMTNGITNSETARSNHTAKLDQSPHSKTALASYSTPSIVHKQIQASPSQVKNSVILLNDETDEDEPREEINRTVRQDNAGRVTTESANPHRHNSFGLLSSMMAVDGGNESDNEEDDERSPSADAEEDEIEYNSDKYFDEEEDEEDEGAEATEDEEEEEEEEEEEDEFDEDEDDDDEEDMEQGDISPPPARMKVRPPPPPQPKATINGKTGASVEDAIEL